MRLLDEHFRRYGAGHIEQDLTKIEELPYTDASHHLGTTRMSADPKTGVVDANCQVHGVDDLYIAGSSVFPTAGHANPTLTIAAMSLRLVDYLKKLAACSSEWTMKSCSASAGAGGLCAFKRQNIEPKSPRPVAAR